MPNSIFDEMKASLGIRTRSVSEVREAVNSAVASASAYRPAISEQLDGVQSSLGEDYGAPSLMAGVASMDVAGQERGAYEPLPEAPEAQPAAEAQAEAAEGPGIDF